MSIEMQDDPSEFQKSVKAAVEIFAQSNTSKNFHNMLSCLKEYDSFIQKLYNEKHITLDQGAYWFEMSQVISINLYEHLTKKQISEITKAESTFITRSELNPFSVSHQNLLHKSSYPRSSFLKRYLQDHLLEDKLLKEAQEIVDSCKQNSSRKEAAEAIQTELTALRRSGQIVTLKTAGLNAINAKTRQIATSKFKQEKIMQNFASEILKLCSKEVKAEIESSLRDSAIYFYSNGEPLPQNKSSTHSIVNQHISNLIKEQPNDVQIPPEEEDQPDASELTPLPPSTLLEKSQAYTSMFQSLRDKKKSALSTVEKQMNSALNTVKKQINKSKSK